MIKNIRTGQIGLLLLVVMGVVVALVLSIASKSFSDTVLSRQEKESSTAFSLAETGVENALSSLVGNPDNATREYTISESLKYKVAQTTTFGLFVKELETSHLNVEGFIGDINIFWTKKSDSSENIQACVDASGQAPAAIEVSVVSGAAIDRYYYNPNGCSPSNGFVNSIDGSPTYLSKATIAISGADTVRIRPIYAGATISVSGIGLPNQLYVINSRAIGGDAQKEIELKRGLDAPPTIFDFAVFSAGTIIK
jgi:hypothetical protein